MVAGLLDGLYFHAIAFTDLRGSLSGSMLLVYLSPIVLRLASLFFAMWTLSPQAQEINTTRSSKRTFEDMVARKHLRLMISEGLLLTSFLPLLIAVYCYLTAEPAI